MLLYVIVDRRALGGRLRTIQVTLLLTMFCFLLTYYYGQMLLVVGVSIYKFLSCMY
jgi:hypothetical protein